MIFFGIASAIALLRCSQKFGNIRTTFISHSWNLYQVPKSFEYAIKRERQNKKQTKHENVKRQLPTEHACKVSGRLNKRKA